MKQGIIFIISSWIIWQPHSQCLRTNIDMKASNCQSAIASRSHSYSYICNNITLYLQLWLHVDYCVLPLAVNVLYFHTISVLLITVNIVNIGTIPSNRNPTNRISCLQGLVIMISLPTLEYKCITTNAHTMRHYACIIKLSISKEHSV